MKLNYLNVTDEQAKFHLEYILGYCRQSPQNVCLVENIFGQKIAMMSLHETKRPSDYKKHYFAEWTDVQPDHVTDPRDHPR